jgi:translation initiation factor 2 subunit 2
MDYNKMVDRAYLSIPQKALEHFRFEIPRADSFIQGSKTIVKNFSTIMKDMRRDDKEFLKFLTKETATSASKTGTGQLTINGKVNMIQLNRLIETYFNQFILCSECKKPDTHILTQDGVRLLKCEACGATKPVKSL